MISPIVCYYFHNLSINLVDRLIDWVHFDHPVLSLTISTNDEFIASSHQDELGIRIWANNCFYSDVLFSSLPRSPVYLDSTILPSSTTSGMSTGIAMEEEDEDEDENNYSLPIPKTGMEVMLPSSVAGKTLTLSHAPSTKWSTLSALEQIRERNKPEEAPKAPEKAPFFLPTTSSLTPEFVAAKEKEGEEEGGEYGEKAEKMTKRFITHGDVLNVENDFQRLIRECATGKTKPYEEG